MCKVKPKKGNKNIKQQRFDDYIDDHSTLLTTQVISYGQYLLQLFHSNNFKCWYHNCTNDIYRTQKCSWMNRKQDFEKQILEDDVSEDLSKQITMQSWQQIFPNYMNVAVLMEKLIFCISWCILSCINIQTSISRGKIWLYNLTVTGNADLTKYVTKASNYILV